MNIVASAGLCLCLVGPQISQAQEWSLRAEQIGSVNRAARDVDITAVTLSAPRGAFAFGKYGVLGGFLASDGRVTQAGATADQTATANAVFLGGYARFEPDERPDAAFSPFVEIGMAAVVTDRNWPAPLRPGDPRARFYGKFDARLGAEVSLSEGLALEGAAMLSHISNAHGQVADNLNFDGAGFSLGITSRW